MKVNKALENLAEKVFSQVDELGYQLSAMGVENQLTRHNLIAMAMVGQKRLEGELDSISAKAESKIAYVESLGRLTKQYLESGVGVATFPISYAFDLVRERK